MVATVDELGAVRYLPLDEPGEELPGHGVIALFGAEVEGGAAGGLVVLVAVGLQADHEVGVEGVGDVGPLPEGRVIVPGSGNNGFHAGGNHAAFHPGCQVPHEFFFGDFAVEAADGHAFVRPAQGGVDDNAFAGEAGSGGTHTFAFPKFLG